MRTRLSAALMAASAALLAAPADAQADPNTRTETQERQAEGRAPFPWDLLGLFGIAGLLGLRREHSDDSYHPAAID